MSEKKALFSKIEWGIAAVAAILLYLTFSSVDFFERLYVTSRAHEAWELDEALCVFIALSFVFYGMCLRAFSKQKGNALKVVNIATEGVKEDLEKLVNSIPVMISYIDQDWTYKFCNRTYREFFVKDDGSILGHHVSDFLGAEMFQELKPYIEQAFSGEMVDFDQQRWTVDGEKIHLHVVYHPDIGKDGRVKGVYSIMNDISDLVLARQSLEAEQNFNNRVVELSSTLVVALERDGTIKLVNKAVADASGYKVEDLTGKNWWDVFFPKGKDDPDVKELNIASEKGRHPIKDYVMPLRRRDGLTRMISWTTVNLFDETGENILEYIAVGHDITDERERAKLEKEHHKMRALALMAGGLAHEINNALQPVLGMADVMKTKFKDDGDPKLQQNLEVLYSNALHARKIVEQVLDFSRRDPEEKKVSGAADVVNEAIDYCRTIIPETVDLDTDGLEDGMNEILIKVDDTGMKQVMANLLGNAADAMDNEGWIKVSLSPFENNEGILEDMKIGDYALLAVADNGPGMDPETLSTLFQPFYTTKKMGQGTGLGLATVYSIVNEWNGKIEVESELGEGSTFKIYIPKSAEEIDRALKEDVIIYVPNVGKTS